MAAPHHPAANQPQNPKARIWRYMDFTKLVSMLENGGLCFSSGDLLGSGFLHKRVSFEHERELRALAIFTGTAKAEAGLGEGKSFGVELDKQPAGISPGYAVGFESSSILSGKMDLAGLP